MAKDQKKTKSPQMAIFKENHLSNSRKLLRENFYLARSQRPRPGSGSGQAANPYWELAGKESSAKGSLRRGEEEPGPGGSHAPGFGSSENIRGTTYEVPHGGPGLCKVLHTCYPCLLLLTLI